MHLDYQQFKALDAEILPIAHDNLTNAQDYFSKNNLPFIGLVDPDHSVYDQYDVESKTMSLGQRPGLFIIDKDGIVRFAFIGTQQWEIPTNQTVLHHLSEIQK